MPCKPVSNLFLQHLIALGFFVLKKPLLDNFNFKSESIHFKQITFSVLRQHVPVSARFFRRKHGAQREQQSQGRT